MWDKLPAEVESPGFKKNTSEFTFLIVTPAKYSEHAKSFMDRVASRGVFFYRPCPNGEEEIDAILADGGPECGLALQALAAGPAMGGHMADVAALAAALDVTEKTVQNYVDDKFLVRTIRGQYDLLASLAAMNKARKDAENAISDDHRNEKMLILRQQRIKLEALNKERLGQLMNAEKTRQAIEHIESGERQALLNMPKTLGPQCDMVPGREVEIKLMDWVRRHLKEESAWDRIVGIVRAALSQLPAQGKDKGRKRKKKK
jgi:hypothetical protein